MSSEAGTMPRWRSRAWLIPLVLGVGLIAAPWIGVPSFWIRQLTLIAIYALIVCGVNLSFGFAGELALGHVAMFAAGAYCAGLLGKHGWDFSIATIGAVLAAGLIGLASGVPGLRLGGWGLAMASFFLVILVPDVVNVLTEQTGGLIGLQGIPAPKLLGHLLTPKQYYVVVTTALVVVFALFRNLVTSRHGAALRVLRQSPVLASSLGINVFRLKMTAYIVGALPAGLAGALFAYLDRFIAPDFFGFELAIAIIAASVLGGSESIYGAFAGAALLQIGPMRSTSFHQYALVAYGAFLVLGGLFLAGGMSGAGARLLRSERLLGWRRARVVQPPRAAASRPEKTTGETVPASSMTSSAGALEETIQPVPGQLLEVDAVTRRFGGVTALDGVTLQARPGAITGLIGPNGCGKTTLLNIVSGFYSPTSGSVSLGGRRIDGQSADRVAVAGVARTFQTPQVPRSMTVVDVVAASLYTAPYIGLLPAMLRLPRFRAQARADEQQARAMLRLLDIEHLALLLASDLPLGSRRLVEVARALASKPAVLLLDEPAAGLDEADIVRFAAAIRRARDAGATVVLVEHNFRLVCDVADEIYVLALGQVLAHGTADEIRADEAVARSYIGESPDPRNDADAVLP